MILRRLAENLRAQNWTAITIEFLIVIIGVFIGMQVSNWNEGRLQRRDARDLLIQLQPEVQNNLDFAKSAREYYDTTGAFATQALAGWAGDPAVSDEDFVIAAYQASQIYGFGTNGNNWALIFGAEQLRDFDDPAIRESLTQLMLFNYDNLELSALATSYRERVRRIIPGPIQAAIREKCGDRRPPGKDFLNMLPDQCSVDLPDAEAKQAASDLRARRDLVEDLRWHLSVTATFLFNVDTLELHTRRLGSLIGRLRNE